MPSDEYTPTTKQIRDSATHFRDFSWSDEEFNRWLTEHDRQVAEKAWDKGRAPVVSRYGEMVTTEAELRALPFDTVLVSPKTGAPWGFGAERWDSETRERHLVEGPLKQLPLMITYIPDPGNPYRKDKAK